MEEKLKVFFAELDAQEREISKLHLSVETKMKQLNMDMGNEDLINSTAYKLHNLYCAYEDMFKLIARFFENQIEDLSRYHRDLLKRMTIKIEGIRPALLSQESFKILDELRGFRHVFRHAYSYGLDGERVIKLAEKTAKLKNSFQKDYFEFKEVIKSSIKSSIKP